MTIYNLNLSQRYVSQWGAWEVAREIICNAIDADPSNMKIESPDRDTLVVTTETVPRLSDLFVIGGGTKSLGGETIGQFGEGLKMAALVATRDGKGVTITIPGQEVTFSLEDCMGESVLHANIKPLIIPVEGMTITVKMPGIANAYAGKILMDAKPGPQNYSNAGLTVFVKGVYIASFSEQAIWDWNLADAQINRDRSMVSTGSVARGIVEWLNKNHTPEICLKMIGCPDSFESSNIELWIRAQSSLAKGLAMAFHSHYGDDAVLASDDDDNVRARKQGLKPISMSQEWLKKVLASGGVKLAADLPKVMVDIESVPTSKYQTHVDKLAKLSEIVEGPPHMLGIMANRSLALGLADIQERRVWLQESLFTSAPLHELYGAFLHELAHLRSGANDETLEFEYTLTQMLGFLAGKVMV